VVHGDYGLMGRKRLFNKPAKGITQTASNGPLVGTGLLGQLDIGYGRHESRAERRAREARERKGGGDRRSSQVQ
jgi:hypothetical protein